jgi:hypothetical protein
MLSLHTGRNTALKWATKFEGGKRQENITYSVSQPNLFCQFPFPLIRPCHLQFARHLGRAHGKAIGMTIEKGKKTHEIMHGNTDYRRIS